MFFKEVNADCLFVVLGEVSFAVSLNHARLADGPVADDDHLEKVVEELVKPYRLRHESFLITFGSCKTV